MYDVLTLLLPAQFNLLLYLFSEWQPALEGRDRCICNVVREQQNRATCHDPKECEEVGSSLFFLLHMNSILAKVRYFK